MLCFHQRNTRQSVSHKLCSVAIRRTCMFQKNNLSDRTKRFWSDVILASVKFFISQPENETGASLRLKIDYSQKHSLDDSQNYSSSNVENMVSSHEKPRQSNRGCPSQQRRYADDRYRPQVEKEVDYHSRTGTVTRGKRILVRAYCKGIVGRYRPSSTYYGLQQCYHNYVNQQTCNYNFDIIIVYPNMKKWSKDKIRV